VTEIAPPDCVAWPIVDVEKDKTDGYVTNLVISGPSLKAMHFAMLGLYVYIVNSTVTVSCMPIFDHSYTGCLKKRTSWRCEFLNAAIKAAL